MKKHPDFWFALLIAAVFVGCNPYKRLAERPPLTPKDSASLMSRCIELIPKPDTTRNKPVLTPYFDSGSLYRQKVDSLMAVKQRIRDSIIRVTTDTCIPKSRVVDNFDEGFRVGYQAGDYDGRRKASAGCAQYAAATDSICRHQLERERRGYELRLITAENAVGIANKNSDKYRGKMDFWKTWALGASCASLLFLIICIILWKFRRQARAANNVLNDARAVIGK